MTSAAVTSPTRVPVPTPAHTDAPELDGFDQFPDFPSRDDMMNTRYLHDQGHQPALRRHLGSPDTTIVLGEVPIAWDVRRIRDDLRVPDLLVAFGVRHSHILAQMGYSINEQGKPPDFVLEIASKHTSRRDETLKWRNYAAFGVGEYWLFDPDWGQRYATGLTGWTLANGRYEPIPIHQYAPEQHYGYSAALDLYVCWEHGQLRWYDPATQTYLLTYDEQQDAHLAERDARMVEQGQRIIAQAQAELERDARIAAEAETQRLRDKIRRLRGAGD